MTVVATRSDSVARRHSLTRPFSMTVVLPSGIVTVGNGLSLSILCVPAPVSGVLDRDVETIAVFDAPFVVCQAVPISISAVGAGENDFAVAVSAVVVSHGTAALADFRRVRCVGPTRRDVSTPCESSLVQVDSMKRPATLLSVSLELGSLSSSGRTPFEDRAILKGKEGTNNNLQGESNPECSCDAELDNAKTNAVVALPTSATLTISIRCSPALDPVVDTVDSSTPSADKGVAAPDRARPCVQSATSLVNVRIDFDNGPCVLGTLTFGHEVPGPQHPLPSLRVMAAPIVRKTWAGRLRQVAIILARLVKRCSVSTARMRKLALSCIARRCRVVLILDFVMLPTSVVNCGWDLGLDVVLWGRVNFAPIVGHSISNMCESSGSAVARFRTLRFVDGRRLIDGNGLETRAAATRSDITSTTRA